MLFSSVACHAGWISLSCLYDISVGGITRTCWKHITVTSLWARWRLKSPASRLFTQPFIQADRRKHQRSASLAFVRWIHRSPVNSPHKWPVTRRMFPFYDVITKNQMDLYVNSFSATRLTPCNHWMHSTFKVLSGLFTCSSKRIIYILGL